MINSIETTNFETHLKTKIDLHPGVNTFVGESDEGKSGIVRQIKWNTRNRPQGDSYRNDQLDPKDKEDRLKLTSVTIDYDGSGKVQRARDGLSGGVNHYVINDGEPLRALRTDVPDEVQEVTRMKDVNIQGQHPSEQYFLLADNPGQVAKKFNKVAGLTVMDDAIKSINSQVRTCNTEIAISKKLIEDKELELKESEWVLKAETFSNKLQEFEKQLIQKRMELKTISEAVMHIESIESKLKDYEGIEKAKIALDLLSEQRQEIIRKEDAITHIYDLVMSIKSIDLSLNSITDTDKALKSLKSLEKLRGEINESDYKIKQIKVLLHKIKVNEEQYQIADRDLMEAKREHDIIREENECPVCGRKGK